MIIRRGTAADVPRALEIWREAVDATHGFLTPADRAEIDVMVAQDFLPQAELWLAEDAGGRVQGFLVMDGTMIDALFVDPTVHGQGIGTALLRQARSLSPDELTVEASEQADNACAFYEARGFVRTGRSPVDPQGRPYPLIHYRLALMRDARCSILRACAPRSPLMTMWPMRRGRSRGGTEKA